MNMRLRMAERFIRVNNRTVVACAVRDILMCLGFFIAIVSVFSTTASAGELILSDLIDEALKNNSEILSLEARAAASRFRIPQAKSYNDPMFMFGYQNDGTKRYTFGETNDSQWMFSASQMFPFPGKLSLKGEMAEKESESFQASYEAFRLRTVARIKELYFDLFLAYKTVDILRDKNEILKSVEDAALARYSSGMGMQQEVLMAQAEKYMLLERQEMARQRIQSLESMLNAAVGRDVKAPLGRPVQSSFDEHEVSIDELIKNAHERSPEIKAKEQMISAADAKVRMSQREYYPDFTLNASYFATGKNFDDMWSLTTTINIPIFYRTKQRQAVNEAEALLREARYELEGTKLMLASAVRDNYSMMTTADRLMDLYKNGLMPKTRQDFDSALANYSAGKAEAVTVITRLKALLDYELSYWTQFAEKEKAMARIGALTGESVKNK